MQQDVKAKLAISFLAIAAIGALLYSVRERALTGMNDFIPFYVAGKLVGSEHLYDVQPYVDFQARQFGAATTTLRFIRLPFYAALFVPLGLLDYQQAYGLWSLLRLLAIVAFVLLWPAARSKADTLLFISLSMPAYMALMTGQDSLLLLPLLAVALRLEERRPFLAGAALSLCAIKFHLFTLIPFLLFAQRRWDIAKGFLAGGCALAALSFAAGGWGWPIDYYRTVTANEIHPNTALMPNLHGLGLPGPAELAAYGLTVFAAWFAMRRVRFDVGLAIALIGGILVSHHCYVMDCVLLVPALMIVILRAEADWLRLASVLFISPLPTLLLLTGPPKSYVMQAGLALLMGALLHWGLRGKAPAARFQPSDSAAI